MHYAVIMAGGSGKRLWPLSRKNRPKQIIELFAGKSLLQHSVNRVKGIFDSEHILVVTNAEYADVVREHLPQIPPPNIIIEPVGRDTANAIGLAATVLNQRDPDAVMAVFSADQIIEPENVLEDAVKKALQFLRTHPYALFTFGIKPAYAHTGFGYLKCGKGSKELGKGIFPVDAFEEKPNKSTARKFIRSGDYCWNSGMFVWRVDTILKQLQKFLPENAERLQRIGLQLNSTDFDRTLNEEFAQLEKNSIDFAVMEKADHVYMCRLECHWMDVGSYQSLADSIGAIDQYDNITTSNACCKWLDSENNIVVSESNDHLIAAIHVEDMIIVHTDDATLICHREETDHLKRLLNQMQAQGLERFL